MDDLASSGNLLEAVLWFLFASVFGFLACRVGGRKRRLFAVFGVAFLLFGVSDLIEARTGAWWRPFWLLLLKAGCIGVFGYAVCEYRRIRRSSDTQAAPRNPR